MIRKLSHQRAQVWASGSTGRGFGLLWTIPRSRILQKESDRGFEHVIPTHRDRLSHHINLARLGGTAVEKLKGNRVQGYRRFAKGVLKSCGGMGTWVGFSE